MFDELTATITFRSGYASAAAESTAPLGWRIAAPLIGSVSIGLWMLVEKALAVLVA